MAIMLCSKQPQPFRKDGRLQRGWVISISLVPSLPNTGHLDPVKLGTTHRVHVPTYIMQTGALTELPQTVLEDHSLHYYTIWIDGSSGQR